MHTLSYRCLEKSNVTKCSEMWFQLTRGRPIHTWVHYRIVENMCHVARKTQKLSGFQRQFIVCNKIQMCFNNSFCLLILYEILKILRVICEYFIEIVKS